mmetsp:Transcript_14953/g.30196  ORF Transcript_14953/g.30196 Transcript_14953/m.30196 type:complete len:303 (+) Transcript_14953:1053-1961(+)
MAPLKRPSYSSQVSPCPCRNTRAAGADECPKEGETDAPPLPLDPLWAGSSTRRSASFCNRVPTVFVPPLGVSSSSLITGPPKGFSSISFAPEVSPPSSRSLPESNSFPCRLFSSLSRVSLSFSAFSAASFSSSIARGRRRGFAILPPSPQNSTAASASSRANSRVFSTTLLASTRRPIWSSPDTSFFWFAPLLRNFSKQKASMLTSDESMRYQGAEKDSPEEAPNNTILLRGAEGPDWEGPLEEEPAFTKLWSLGRRADSSLDPLLCPPTMSRASTGSAWPSLKRRRLIGSSSANTLVAPIS